MITKVANLPDQSVRYLEAGQGRALVLIHGFPFNAEAWLPQLHRPPIGWRVIAPDLRGFRGSGPAFESVGLEHVTVDSYATDVLTLMTHLEIDRAVVCGLSMGGYVALAVMRQAPSRIAGLVLANTRAGADSADGRTARDRMLALVAREGPAAVAREMLPKLLGETSQRDQPDLIDAVRHLIEVNSTEALAAAIRALKGRPDATPGLAAIDVPALIVTGDEDTLIPPSESDVLHQAIRGSRLVVLPRVGHLSNLEDPLSFNQALARFTTSGVVSRTAK